MAQQSSSTIDSFLVQKRVNDSITKQIEEKINPILTENEKLKKENEELQKQLVELSAKLAAKDEKYSTIPQQLLTVNYLLDLDKLRENKTVEQLGAFFSPLLNRHPQRARAPFSSFHELTYSANKATATTILRDLLIVQKRLEEFGLKATAKKLQKAIDKLNDKHFK